MGLPLVMQSGTLADPQIRDDLIYLNTQVSIPPTATIAIRDYLESA
jgi:hypothetical protein